MTHIYIVFVEKYVHEDKNDDEDTGVGTIEASVVPMFDCYRDKSLSVPGTITYNVSAM